ncbi:MAG: FG-GAP-like repeat-containing protein [Cyclobacteriaceae bacterium]
MKVKGIFFSILFCLSLTVLAQQPIVSFISKMSAAPGETITIGGTNFVANSQVNFGPAVASFNFISSTQMEVTVPTNAAYGPITVTNLTNGLSGSSTQSFTMSFGGSSGLSASDFEQYILPETGNDNKLIWDVCLCNLDDDGDLDGISTHSESNNIFVFRNGSTVSNTTFSIPGNVGPANPVNVGIKTAYIECSDLDGDGKSDIAIGATGGTPSKHLQFYRNNYSGSTISIMLDHSIDIPEDATGNVTGNKSVNTFKLVDIDGDGKKDVLVGNDTDNDPSLIIYLNTSSVGNISFATTPITFTLPTNGALKARHLDFGNLNGDGATDIVVSTGTGIILAYKNQSTNGEVKFASPVELNISDSPSSVNLVDLTDDGLAELVVVQQTQNLIRIYTNTTTDPQSSISFSSATLINQSAPLFSEAGDLNGDGLSDLAVSTATQGILLLENTSSGGNLSFATGVLIDLEGTKATRNLKIADINGDAKPDIVAAFNSVSSGAGEFSVITNRSCLAPSISPADVSFCYDIAFDLSAPKAFGVTYAWSSTEVGVTFDDNTAENVSVTVAGGSASTIPITLTMNSTDGSCTDPVTQNYSLVAGVPAAAPTINIDQAGTVCGGDAFTLSTSTTGASYLWTLPDGSEATTSTITVSDASTTDAGIYTLRVQESGGCYGNTGTITVDVDVPPSLSIANTSGNNNFCSDGDGITLEVPEYDGLSLKWFKDGVDQSNSTGTITAQTTGGVYTVEVTSDDTGCTTTSESLEVFAIAPPAPMITANSEICVDVPLDFSAESSTSADGFAVTHSWDFKDGNTATGLTATNTFTTAGTYLVELTTSYDDVDLCSDVITLSVTVSDIPTIDITNVSGTTVKCPSDSVELSLPANYQAIDWLVDGVSTGNTSPSFYAKTTEGQSSVEITANVTTDIGCTTQTEPLSISNFSDSGISITAEGYTSDQDTIQLESGIKSVVLTASTAGGSNYMWEALDLNILSTTSGQTTEVFPGAAFTTVTATATDGNGCTESQNIVIEKPGLQPRKAFSPNGDTQNDCWEIINSDTQVGCTIYIFDSRGSRVFEGKSPFPNNCVWNGQINGNGGDAVEGVYFFVLKCDDKSSSQTGTILLAR